MTLEQAAVFLSSSILIATGVIILIAGAIVVNNLINRFWKPVTIFTRESFSIFGGHHLNDPIQNLSQEEYDKLVENLEKFRAEKRQVDKNVK